MRGTQQNNTIIQPRKFANKNGEIRFSWPIKEFTQLCEMLFSDIGEVNVRLRGSFDHQQRCLIEADIVATMQLECQTSFEAIEFEVKNQVTYCTVTDESQFAEVEENYEAVLIDEGMLDIKKVIEDELILSVPIASNKSKDQLEQKMSFGELDEVAIAEEEKASNPFSVLTNLKNTD